MDPLSVLSATSHHRPSTPTQPQVSSDPEVIFRSGQVQHRTQSSFHPAAASNASDSTLQTTVTMPVELDERMVMLRQLLADPEVYQTFMAQGYRPAPPSAPRQSPPSPRTEQRRHSPRAEMPPPSLFDLGESPIQVAALRSGPLPQPKSMNQAAEHVYEPPTSIFTMEPKVQARPAPIPDVVPPGNVSVIHDPEPPKLHCKITGERVEDPTLQQLRTFDEQYAAYLTANGRTRVTNCMDQRLVTRWRVACPELEEARSYSLWAEHKAWYRALVQPHVPCSKTKVLAGITAIKYAGHGEDVRAGDVLDYYVKVQRWMELVQYGPSSIVPGDRLLADAFVRGLQSSPLLYELLKTEVASEKPAPDLPRVFRLAWRYASEIEQHNKQSYDWYGKRDRNSTPGTSKTPRDASQGEVTCGYCLRTFGRTLHHAESECRRKAQAIAAAKPTPVKPTVVKPTTTTASTPVTVVAEPRPTTSVAPPSRPAASPSAPASTPSVQANATATTSQKQCNYCGKSGHVESTCFAKARDTGKPRQRLHVTQIATVDDAADATTTEQHDSAAGQADDMAATTTSTTIMSIVDTPGADGLQLMHMLRLDQASTSTAPSQPSSTASSTIEGVPRAKFIIRFPGKDEQEVTALLDTGATADWVTPAMYSKLADAGFTVSRLPKPELVLLGGGQQTCTTGRVVHVQLHLRKTSPPSQAVTRDLRFDVQLREMPNSGNEDIILGYPTLLSTGLLHRIADLHEYFVMTQQDTISDDQNVPSTITSTSDVTEDEDASLDVVDIHEMLGTERSVDECNIQDAMSPEGRRQLDETLREYSDVFGPLPPDGARLPHFSIEYRPGCEEPKPRPLRRQSEAITAEIHRQTEEYLKAGVIRRVTSHRYAPAQILLAHKKDGTWRYCTDFRQVNDATETYHGNLPLCRDLLASLKGKKWFCSLDLTSGFTQCTVREQDRCKTVFRTTDGLFEWVRCPFGLKNLPMWFQDQMRTVFADLEGVICSIYIDDIVVFADTEKQLIERLRMILQRAREFNIRFKPSKCHFGLQQLEYLGFIVDADGIHISQSRRAALLSMRPPKSTAELRSFLGLANFFRDFVHGYATAVKPLTELCSTKRQFEWTPRRAEAFEQVQRLIADAPVLRHVDYTRPLILRTDASTVGIGAVLLQVDAKGDEHPIGFVSKAFNETEKRWSTYEQECYAMVRAILSFRHYLLGHKFRLETDHRNLTFIERPDASPKVVRWRLALQPYDFDVVHIPGTSNHVADALSRLLQVGIQAVSTSTESTEEISAIEKKRRFDQLHNDVVGHRGIHATLHALTRNKLDWPGMRSDVSTYVHSCPQCQKNARVSPQAVVASLTNESFEPFELVCIDFIGPLPDAADGSRYVHVIMDCFTRFVELRATPTCSAEEAARTLLDVFGRYGAPLYLRSDQGPSYTAAVISQFLTLVNSTHRPTLPYRPQSNGAVERANQEVMRHLRALLFDRSGVIGIDDWPSLLPLVQRIVNATVHSSTGFSPAQLLFGNRINLDRALVTGTITSSPDAILRNSEHAKYLSRLVEAQATLLAAAQRHQDEIVERRRAVDPDTPEPTRFAVGDLVLVRPVGKPEKLAPRLQGPYIVISIGGHDMNQYVLEHLASHTRPRSPVHVERLVPFTPLIDPEGHITTDFAATDAARRDAASVFFVDDIVDHCWARRVRSAEDPTVWVKGDVLKAPPPRAGLKLRRSLIWFRVKWLGYTDDEATWEPLANVEGRDALTDYLVAHPKLAKLLKL